MIRFIRSYVCRVLLPKRFSKSENSMVQILEDKAGAVSYSFDMRH